MQYVQYLPRNSFASCAQEVVQYSNIRTTVSTVIIFFLATSERRYAIINVPSVRLWLDQNPMASKRKFSEWRNQGSILVVRSCDRGTVPQVEFPRFLVLATERQNNPGIDSLQLGDEHVVVLIINQKSTISRLSMQKLKPMIIRLLRTRCRCDSGTTCPM